MSIPLLLFSMLHLLVELVHVGAQVQLCVEGHMRFQLVSAVPVSREILAKELCFTCAPPGGTYCASAHSQKSGGAYDERLLVCEEEKSTVYMAVRASQCVSPGCVSVQCACLVHASRCVLSGAQHGRLLVCKQEKNTMRCTAGTSGKLHRSSFLASQSYVLALNLPAPAVPIVILTQLL
eukprot:380636-Pelagomonas_calceolata.AAC.6